VTPYQIGFLWGFEYITLTHNNLPTHNHAATFTPSGGTGASGTMKVLDAGGSSPTPATDGWIAGGNANLFAPTKLPFANEVEISGLTVSGGGGTGGTVSLADNGASDDHYNMAPFQAVNFSICEFGLYPSRN